MAKNCLNCTTRVKADKKWDENEGDYWHCTAVVPVHGFGIMWLENRNINADLDRIDQAVGRLTNLNHFREDNKQYKSGILYDCPLWSQRK